MRLPLDNVPLGAPGKPQILMQTQVYHCHPPSCLMPPMASQLLPSPSLDLEATPLSTLAPAPLSHSIYSHSSLHTLHSGHRVSHHPE